MFPSTSKDDHTRAYVIESRGLTEIELSKERKIESSKTRCTRTPARSIERDVYFQYTLAFLCMSSSQSGARKLPILKRRVFFSAPPAPHPAVAALGIFAIGEFCLSHHKNFYGEKKMAKKSFLFVNGGVGGIWFSIFVLLVFGYFLKRDRPQSIVTIQSTVFPLPPPKARTPYTASQCSDN